MSRCWLCCLTLMIVSLFSGCARFPEGETPPPVPPRTLVSQITVAGTINPSYYYFLALDTDNDPGDGPVPIVTGPELGNGWGTISGIGPDDPVPEPPFFVRFHNGQFQQYRNGEPIGAPYRGTILDANGAPALVGPTLFVEVNQEDILGPGQPLPQLVQLNWITNVEITTQPQNPGIAKQYDGFGPTGNDYLDSVQLGVAQTLQSGVGGVPEEEVDQTTTTDVPDIDMINWVVETRIR